MTKRIVNFIIYIIIIGFVIYQFGIPKYEAIDDFEDSRSLYTSIKSDVVKWQLIDYSELGNAIYLAEFGNSDDVCVIVGGLHGSEYGGFNLALRLARFINTNQNLIKKKTVIIPTINPDGLLANTRQNSNKVDLNRNFPSRDWTPAYKSDSFFPGSNPASEKETNVFLSVLSKYKPDKIIDIHTALHLIDFDGPANSLAQKIASINGYNIKTDVGYETPGSLSSYTGIDLGIPTIVLELPEYNPEEAWLDNKDALIAAINF